MKKTTLNSLLICCFTFLTLCLTAQDAPPSEGIFRLKNVATGKYLTDAGTSTTAVTMSDSGEELSTHFTIVQTGDFYNIDSEVLGILRAPGAGGPGGPYVVVSTTKESPATDSDKVWKIQHNATDDTYRFQSGTSSRYMYHDANGTVTHVEVPETDDRSNWELVPLEIPSAQIPVGTLRFQNVETEEYLTTAVGSNLPVTMSATGEAENTHWTLVESGDYYNIDSESESGGTGILRAPGAGSSTGAYVVLSTLKAPPATDTDKTWTVDYDGTTETYRFGSRTTGRYLYQNADGTVTHSVAEATDDRSNWRLVPLVVIPEGAAPDEDTNPDLACPASGEFDNNNTRDFDIANPENVGTIDDRTCYSDYSESTVYNQTWGVYNITHESNHMDAPNTLQPRMERSLSRSSETGIGSYARFTGTLRILEVGDTAGTSQDGSYFMQAKGKHTGGGGSADPAICLYLAMPVYGDDGNGNQVQVSFDIVREQINYRGGSGAGGRTIVFLKNVAKNEIVDIELEVGFREDLNNPGSKIHYSDAVIGGEAFNWNIPEPERGVESGIRYGAYRVKGGRAQMRWANTTYEKEEIVDNSAPELRDDVIRLRNVETGQFLTDAGVSASAVSMTDLGNQSTYWSFVKSGSYYNIDSEALGILRAPGAGGPGGPYVVVSTTKESPATDTDKTWTIYYDETTETYRFESRTSGRFLYHNEDGTVTHSVAPATDNRSVWEAIPIQPVTDVSFATTQYNLNVGDTLNIPYTILPEDATNKEVSWSTDNNSVLTVDETGLITALAGGTAIVTITTVDGSFTDTAQINVQGAFGNITQIPAIIEAEDYDLGGANLAYSDTSAGNSGGEYRDDDVDISITTDLTGSYHISDFETGEWLEYTVNVPMQGEYYITARVSSRIKGSIKIEAEGASPILITVPKSGKKWKTIGTGDAIALNSGENNIRVTAEIGGFLLNYFEIEAVPSACAGVANWKKNKTYSKRGTQVLFKGILYENNHYTKGEKPGTGNDWTAIDFCGAPNADCFDYPLWNPNDVYGNSDTYVVYNSRLYRSLVYITKGKVPGVDRGWEFVSVCTSSSLATPPSACPSDAVTYQRNKKYKGSTYVTYNGNLYISKWDVPARRSPDKYHVWELVRACTSGTATTLKAQIALEKEKIIEDTAPSTIQVYPNPVTNGQVNLHFEEDLGKVDIKLLELSGQVLHEQNISAYGYINLQINGLVKNNVYILLIKTDESTFIKKLISK